MKLEELASSNKGAVPLYSIPNGATYEYYCDFSDKSYKFVKHIGHEFPAVFFGGAADKELKVYQYDVAIEESTGIFIVFIVETELVYLIEIQKEIL
jgi:hypothetical protein